MLADYVLACGHTQVLLATDGMLLVGRLEVEGSAYCDECRDWCVVVERVDPADQGGSPSRTGS